MGVIVDTGAWTNLWGWNWALRLAHRAKARGLRDQITNDELRRPLYVAGVGNGSQQAKIEAQIPIATSNRDGSTGKHFMRAPAVEGAGCELPALLGLQSMQSNDGVVETGVKQKRPSFPGLGGWDPVERRRETIWFGFGS